MDIKEIIINNFQKAMEEHSDEIDQLFLKENVEHLNGPSFEELKEKKLEKIYSIIEEDLINADDKGLINLSRETALELVGSDSSSQWIRNLKDKLADQGKDTAEQISEFFKENPEGADKLIKEAKYAPLSLYDFKLLKSKEYFLNRELFHEVDKLLEYLTIDELKKDFLKRITMEIQSGSWKLDLFRAIKVNDYKDYLSKLGSEDNGLGQYWSRDKKRAQTYDAHKNESLEDDSAEIKFSAKLDPEGIDYKYTIAKNINQGYGDFEKEVVMIPDANILVYKIEVLKDQKVIEELDVDFKLKI